MWRNKMELSEIFLAVEYFALTPVAPIVEWYRTSRQGPVLGTICVVHTVACVAFWTSFAHNAWWRTTQLAVSTMALLVLWLVNVARAYRGRKELFGGSGGGVYHACLMALSVVNFVTAAPLFGKSNADAKYGKWVIFVLNAISVTQLVTVIFIAYDYWVAWGCYAALRFPWALKYQSHGVCYDSTGGGLLPPVCVNYSANDPEHPCPYYAAGIMAPFTGVFEHAMLQIGIAYALFIALVFRTKTGGTLVERIKNFRSSLAKA